MSTYSRKSVSIHTSGVCWTRTAVINDAARAAPTELCFCSLSAYTLALLDVHAKSRRTLHAAAAACLLFPTAQRKYWLLQCHQTSINKNIPPHRQLNFIKFNSNQYLAGAFVVRRPRSQTHIMRDIQKAHTRGRANAIILNKSEVCYYRFEKGLRRKTTFPLVDSFAVCAM